MWLPTVFLSSVFCLDSEDALLDVLFILKYTTYCLFPLKTVLWHFAYHLVDAQTYFLVFHLMCFFFYAIQFC